MEAPLTQEEFNELILEALVITCEKDEARKLRNLLRDFFGKELKDIVMQASNDHCYTIDSPELKSAISKQLAVTCAMHGSVECLKMLLQRLPGVFDLNAPDESGMPCLHHAVVGHHVEAVVALIQNGALVDGRDSKQRCALHLAVAYQQRDIVLLLLAKKAALDSQDAVGATPLHYAIQMCSSDAADREAGMAILLCLLRAKASVDGKDNRGRVPLHWAAAAGNSEVCRILCTYNATADFKDNSGQAAIHLVAKTAFTDVIYTLVRDCNADVNLRDSNRQTALVISAVSNQIENVKALLELGARDSADCTARSAVHATAAAGELKAVELLQAAGHNMWLSNLRGELPIHLAIAGKKNDVVYYLLQHSKRGNPRGAVMRSCFHIAAGSGNVEIMSHLLQLGVSVNSAMKYQSGYQLPLDVAEQKSQPEAAAFVREHGGLPASAVVPQSAVVVQRTIRRVVSALRRTRAAAVAVAEAAADTAADAAQDAATDAAADAVADAVAAAVAADAAAAAVTQRQPTNVDDAPTDVRPFLGLLHRRLLALREQSPLAQQHMFTQLMLHERQSNPHGPALRSCFHMAAASGNTSLVSSLIDAGVSVNCIVEYGGTYKTPLDVAEEKEQTSCALYLRQNGADTADSVMARSAIVLQRAARSALRRRRNGEGHAAAAAAAGGGTPDSCFAAAGVNQDVDADEDADLVKPHLSLLYRRVDRLKRAPLQ